jgi:hypothetical protein
VSDVVDDKVAKVRASRVRRGMILWGNNPLRDGIVLIARRHLSVSVRVLTDTGFIAVYTMTPTKRLSVLKLKDRNATGA